MKACKCIVLWIRWGKDVYYSFEKIIFWQETLTDFANISPPDLYPRWANISDMSSDIKEKQWMYAQKEFKYLWYRWVADVYKVLCMYILIGKKEGPHNKN